MNQPSSFSKTLDDIHDTLVELEQAAENIQSMAHTAKQSGVTKLLKNPRSLANMSNGQLRRLLKQVDMNQIYMFLQSPAVQKIISDPEFYQLFMPDTGQQPGTRPEQHRPENSEDIPQR